MTRHHKLVTSRNAAYQQWAALLTNRTKRHRLGEFLVHGVRPITLARRYGWPIRALLYPYQQRLSGWAEQTIDGSPAAEIVGVAPELLAELGHKDDQGPELIAVVATPPDSLDRLPRRPDTLIVAFDRPTSPGNLGSVIRSADALGAQGVVVLGHAADPYDPKAVRASTGSLFALPVVRLDKPETLRTWATAAGFRLVGMDESGAIPLGDSDLTGPILLIIGNETRGMSAALLAWCDQIVSIPISGSASSLNAAAAATVVLYEAARQRVTR